MGDCEPLGLFLVSKGTKGDRLLFAYPFSSANERIKKEVSYQATPYSISSHSSEVPVTQIPSSDCDPESVLQEEYCKLPAYIMAYLFTVRPELCGDRFELKINDVRFVGFPLTVAGRSNCNDDEDTPSILLFNIIFILRARASKSIVSQYQDLSQSLAIALEHEESRCGFLSEQANAMLQCQDDVQALPEDERAYSESPYKLMLAKSLLARQLKQVFDDIRQYGMVSLHINDWIEVSFCVAQKVLKIRGIRPSSPQTMDSALQYLRPFHALLLLEKVSDVLAWLPLDASPSLIHLLNVISPLKSLQTLTLDADLPMSQVFLLCRELVLWGKAIIIYPLCETNVYTLAPDTGCSNIVTENFAELFAGANLVQILAQFSPPVKLSDFTDGQQYEYDYRQQNERVQMVIWLLGHGLLKQLHKYLYLCVPRNYKTSSNLEQFEGEINPKILNSLTDALNDCALREVVLDIYARHKRSCKTEDEIKALDDLMNIFIRLCIYFTGDRHLEDIMYSENMARTQLLRVCELFSTVLVTVEHTDHLAHMLYDH